ncbi:MAG: 23S rRNA (adenine(2503)-C(2))-methyltransferase RlmN [Puniceicoccaceae bacterium]|nr:MAG: 23S rRNA (adenine(2503)-C(2))-methyltransferase RlmN [Puniceicoccaceae bacterium]
MKFSPPLPPAAGLTPPALESWLAERAEPAFRGRQILEWVFHHRVADWEEMTNLPRALRAALPEGFDLEPTRLVLDKTSSDVTDKLLLELRDGSLIETVLIRAPQQGVGQEQSRRTICLSTQVGCAYGCRFCASGLAGWKRDLSAGEIVAQVLEVCRLEEARSGRDPTGRVPFDNIVVMGMGEPLANYDALLAALTTINAPWGFNFGARRITVSTSGLVPQILSLAKEALQCRLAVSLHGATNEVRDQIMPINRKYPLEVLLPAVREFTRSHGRMVTLEFILIAEVNDSPEQAARLGEIAADLHAHVNLIPYNRVDGLPWERPSLERQEAFVEQVRRSRVSVTIRREKGGDISAACGQLRLKVEQDRPAPLIPSFSSFTGQG